MVRTVKAPDERKAEIIEKAAKLFATKGLAKTSVSDIVKSVGVAQGTFYWYFKSKQEIINAIVENQCFSYGSKLNEIVDNPKLNGYQKLIGIRDQLFGNVIHNDELIEQFHQESNRVVHDQLVGELTKMMVPLLTKVIAQGIKEKIIKVSDPKKAAFFIFGATHIVNEVEINDKEDLSQWKKAITDFAMKGLGYKGDIKWKI